MTDKFLTDEELCENYGVGYSLMVKMGWTAASHPLPPVFTNLNRSSNSEKRSGFGFVQEENRKLDFEFEDMMGKMANLTTKMPNSKSKSLSSGETKVKQIISAKSKPGESSRPEKIPSPNVVEQTIEDHSKSPKRGEFTTQCLWNDVTEQSGAPEVNRSSVKPKILMKIKQKKVLRNNLSVFE